MNDDALDREVREALEPRADAVDRVIRGATSHEYRSSLVLLRVVAGAVVLLVAGVLFLARGASVAPAGSTQLTNINDTIVVRPTSGGVWLVGGAETGARLPPGTIVVVHTSGESR